jgi:hypothetical protein
MFLYWAGRECESFNQASQTRRCVSLSGCLLVRLLPIGVIVRVGEFLVGAIRRSSSGLERSSMRSGLASLTGTVTQRRHGSQQEIGSTRVG